MRPKLNDKKGTHQFHTIQFTDKAIINLKYNKKTEKRQRIRVKLKNAPRGISLRWTPISNKKVFQLEFRFRGKKYRHDCGVFTPGVYTCNSLMDYMVKLNEKHLDTEGNSYSLIYLVKATIIYFFKFIIFSINCYYLGIILNKFVDKNFFNFKLK